MSKDFTVTIHNPERIEEWLSVFGMNTLYVKSPFPHLADLPGHPDTLIYELDLNQYTDQQRQALVAHIAAKFGLDPGFVEAELDRIGVPILADDCAVAIHNPQRWF